MPRNGAPRKSSTAMAAAATAIGRRMTKMRHAVPEALVVLLRSSA